MPIALRGVRLRSFRSHASHHGFATPVATLRAGVELLLVVLLAVQAARLGWLLLAPAGPLLAHGDATAAPVTTPPALLLSFDPFQSAVGDPASAPADASGLHLHGVRMAGAGSSAILSASDAPQAAFRAGDTVAPGITLQAVASDHVILRTASGERRLALDASPTPMHVAPGRARTPQTGTTGTAGPTAAVDPAALVAQAGFSARVENGTITGYTLIPRGDGALLRQAGLEPGDVLLAVNGNPLTPERIAELEPELARGQARITVQRDGQTRTLTLRTTSP